MFNGDNVLITGVNSTLGIELAAQLSNAGACITGMGRNPPKSRNLECGSFIRHDLMNPLEGTNQKFSSIFHLAAVPGSRFFVDNNPLAVYGNSVIDYNIFNYAEKSGVENFYYMSSATAQSMELLETDSPNTTITKEMEVSPDGLFGWQKRGSEIYLEDVKRFSNLRTISFRLFSLYAGIQGGDDSLSKWLDSAKNSGEIAIWGGNQIRSYIHYSDAVSAMMLVIKKSDYPSRVDIGSDDRYAVSDLANLISASAPFPVTLNYEKYGGTRFRNQISSQEILDSYNWKPRFNISDTILRYFSN